MGLKFGWTVKDFAPCCHNCCSMIDNGQTFGCKKGVKIENNHFTKLNSVVCELHSFYKDIKIKTKRFKNKSARF